MHICESCSSSYGHHSMQRMHGMHAHARAPGQLNLGTTKCSALMASASGLRVWAPGEQKCCSGVADACLGGPCTRRAPPAQHRGPRMHAQSTASTAQGGTHACAEHRQHSTGGHACMRRAPPAQHRGARMHAQSTSIARENARRMPNMIHVCSMYATRTLHGNLLAHVPGFSDGCRACRQEVGREYGLQGM
jgi:hypothetical protein